MKIMENFYTELTKMAIGEESIIDGKMVRCIKWDKGEHCGCCIMEGNCPGCRSDKLKRVDGIQVKYEDIERKSYEKHQHYVRYKYIELINKKENNIWLN